MPKTYMDDNGNPIPAQSSPGKTYLDESGNPMPASGPGRGGTQSHATAPQPIKYGAGNRIADDPDMGAPEPSMAPGLPGHPGVNITGGLSDIGRGDIARGSHRVFSGTRDLASVLAPSALVAAPAAFLGGAAGAGVGSVAGSGIANAFGATPDQSDVAGDVTSIPFGAFGGAAGNLAGKVAVRTSQLPMANMLDAAQHLPWPIGQTVRAGRALFAVPEREPFAPVRPNPNIARTMPFGGPIDTYGGRSFGPPSRSGGPVTPIVPTANPPFQPVRVNPNVARSMPAFGGPIDMGGGRAFGPPSRPGGPITPIQAPEVAPAPIQFAPVRPNPNIAKTLRFGGPTDTSGGRSYSAIPSRPSNGAARLPVTGTAATSESALPVATSQVSNASPNPSVTQQYKPSRTNSRFDADGKRLWPGRK